MIATEEKITMAARIYEMRSAAKSMLGEGYEQEMRDNMRLILEAQKNTGGNELAAAIQIAKRLKENGYNDAAMIPVFAAAVEMVEGILRLPRPGAVVKYRVGPRVAGSQVAEGSAIVVQAITPEGMPSHLRRAERQLLVRGLTGTAGAFLVAEKDLVK